MKKFAPILMFLAGWLVSASGHGAGSDELIFSQPPLTGNLANASTSDAACGTCLTSSQVLAEDFVISESRTISKLAIYGVYAFGNMPQQPADEFTVVFHNNDAGGVPGSDIVTQTNVPVVRELIDDTVTFHLYRFELEIDDVSLDAGIYWVQIFNNTTNNPDDFFWSISEPDPSPTPGFYFDETSAPASGSDWILTGDLGPGLQDGLAIDIFAAVISPDELVFSQPPRTGNLANASTSDAACGTCLTSSQVLAEDFVISESRTISRLAIYGVYAFGNMPQQPADEFTVVFHNNDAGGVPGSDIVTQTNVPVVRELIDDTATFHLYRFELDIDDVSLDVGIYWVQIFNNTTNNPDDFFWSISEPDPSPTPGFYFDETSAPASGSDWILTGDLGPGLQDGLAIDIYAAATVSPDVIFVDSFE